MKNPFGPHVSIMEALKNFDSQYRQLQTVCQQPIVWVCHPCHARLEGVPASYSEMFCPACQRPMEYHGPPRKVDAIDITPVEDTTPRQLPAPGSDTTE